MTRVYKQSKLNDTCFLGFSLPIPPLKIVACAIDKKVECYRVMEIFIFPFTVHQKLPKWRDVFCAAFENFHYGKFKVENFQCLKFRKNPLKC